MKTILFITSLFVVLYVSSQSVDDLIKLESGSSIVIHSVTVRLGYQFALGEAIERDIFVSKYVTFETPGNRIMIVKGKESSFVMFDFLSTNDYYQENIMAEIKLLGYKFYKNVDGYEIYRSSIESLKDVSFSKGKDATTGVTYGNLTD